MSCKLSEQKKVNKYHS